MSELTPEQRAAVDSRDIDVLCEAGAGTGKTTVLVERFVAAVCDDGVEISSMLAFTFTDRAADQLRGRIRGALRARARVADAAGDEDRAQELERMARDTESANISTIHGFCRRLLAAHPAAAGVDPRFRVVEAGEATRLQARAFTLALDELLSTADPDAASRIVAAATPPVLRTIVATAYDELRSRGRKPELPEIEPADAGAAVADLAAAAHAALDETEESGKAKPDPSSRLEEAIALGERDDLTRALDTVIGLELKTKAGGYTGAACAEYREAWARARRALAEVELAGSYGLVRELLGAYARRYEALKAARSGLDFEDLQLRAVDLLRRNEGAQGSFAHVLVDEFQDTNTVQRDLIRLLQGADTRLFCVGDELQSIYGFRHADLAVFRAERERFRRMDPARGRVLALTGNFRARPDVIAAVNSIGEATQGERYTPLSVGSAPEPGPPPGGGPAVELLLTASGRSCDWSAAEVGLDLDDDEPAPPSRVAEARAVATSLASARAAGVPRSSMVVLLRSFSGVDAYERALADAGLDPYVVGGRGYWSSQQVEDVLAILGVIANPLDDEAVLGALASQACAVKPDTLWILRRIATDRGERKRSPRVWPTVREVVTGETPDEGEAARWLAAIEPEELERLTAFHRRIEALREDAALLGLQGLIEAACERLGYDLATLMRNDGVKRWANVRKLMRLAGEFEANEGAELRSFLAYAAEEGDRAAEGDAPVAAERHDGVRIMTVHKAKGLEFEVVAVPELGRRLLTGFPPAIRIGTLEPAEGATRDEEDEEAASPIRIGLRLARLGRPTERLYELDELTAQAEVEESEEELRLAHVAATRAEKKLILSGTFSPTADLDGEVKPGAPVTERLLRAYGGEIAALIGDRRSGRAEIDVPAPEPRPGLTETFGPSAISVRIRFPEEGAGAELAPEAVEERRGRDRRERIAPPLLSIPTPPASAARLSYSSLAAYDRCGYRFYAERELGIGLVADGSVPTIAATRDEGISRESDPAGEAEGDELLAPGEGGAAAEPSARAQRFGLGNAVHRLLEWSARSRWAEPGGERAKRVLRAEGLPGDDAEVERALEMVAGWLGSSVCAQLREARAALRPEHPFLLPLEGALIRGSIDLHATLPDGETVIVDYKTDRLGGEDPATHLERYEVQRAIYALAAGGAPIRSVYSFLERPDAPVELSFDADGLKLAAARVGELLSGIRAGRFEVTRHPHAALCADCPATLLCSHDRNTQLRRDPNPAVEPAGRSQPTSDADPASEGQMSLIDR